MIRARRDNSRGAALIEFGLVALLFLMLLVVFVDLGMMFLVQNSVVNAARAGVRYAIVNGDGGGSRTGATDLDITAAVQKFASAGPLVKGDVTVTVTREGYAPGSLVGVRAVYPYHPFLTYFFPLVINMGSTSWGRITF